MNVEDTETLHLEGWLLKRGPSIDYEWEHRWCSLTSRRLLYYSDQLCKDKRGSIAITPATVAISFTEKAAPGDAATHSAKKPFGFVLDVDPYTGCTFVEDAQAVVGRRTLVYFDAKSAPELEQWKVAIRKAALEAALVLYPSLPEPEKYSRELEKKLQLEMAIKVQRLGHAHQEALQSASDLAEFVRSQCRSIDAEDLHQRTMDVRADVLGENHPHTLLSKYYLALCLRDQQKFDRAAATLQQVLEKQDKTCGPDHPYSIGSACAYADCLKEQHSHYLAEQYLERALKPTEQTLGTKHRYTLNLVRALADNFISQGKYKDAEPFLKRVLDYTSEAYGDGHPETDKAIDAMVDCLCRQGRDWDAEPLLSRRSPGAATAKKSARQSFQGQLMRLPTKPEDVVNLLIIADLGQDNDDEMALMLTSELVRNGEVLPLAVVANLRPADKRAALARGSLDMLGLQDVPVGIGTDGGSTTHKDTFSEYISAGKTGIDYIREPLDAIVRIQEARGTPREDEVEKQARIFDGQKLMKRTLQNATDRSVTLVLLSSMTDAAQLLKADEKLFVAKVKRVAVMGGVKGEAGTFPKLLEPNDAHNNMFDFPAAEFFYKRCQELGVQLIVLSRFAAYGCPVQRKVYDLMVRCPIPNPVLCRLHRAQRDTIERLWKNVCEGGGMLPARCDRKWFCDTFCKGQGSERGGDDQMWDLVKTFNMYDPMALLAALPVRREFFFDPIRHKGLKGVEHLIIGTSNDCNGIRANHEDDLHDYLLTTWIRAAGRPRGNADERRPEELDSGDLTAALDPMVTHTEEEMNRLNKDVLGLLDNEWPRLKNSSLLETWRERDELMRKIGGPPMLLLDYETVERLSRIPHSAEMRGISMKEAAKIADDGNLRFFIEMFSHRWSSRFAPDDRWNSKARAIVEWGKYRKSMGFRTFFWVDFTCIDQGDIGPGVSMLPLYVSTCNNIICYDTPPYEPRAWCRVERLMFAAFVAPNNEYMSPDFTFDPDTAETMPNKELKPKSERKSKVPDPAGEDSQLSYPADSQLIEELKVLCTTHWARCWKENLSSIMMKNGYEGITNLKFGTTEIRLRKF